MSENELTPKKRVRKTKTPIVETQPVAVEENASTKNDYRVLVAFCGPKESGKSSLCNALVKDGLVKERVFFANQLKKIAVDFFRLTPEQAYGTEKEKPLPVPVVISEVQLRKLKQKMLDDLNSLRIKHDFNPAKVGISSIPRGPFKTPRELLQQLGTEILQTFYKPYSTMMTLVPLRGQNGIYVIDDLRFPAEYEQAKKEFHYFYPIRIIGRNEDNKDKHISENAWKYLKFVAQVDSNCSLDKFIENGKMAIEEVKKHVDKRIADGDTPPPQEQPEENIGGLKQGKGNLVLKGKESKIQVRW